MKTHPTVDDLNLDRVLRRALPANLAVSFIESSTKLRDFNNAVDVGALKVIAIIAVNTLLYTIPCNDVDTIERITTLYNRKRIQTVRFFQINSLSANQAKDIINE